MSINASIIATCQKQSSYVVSYDAKCLHVPQLRAEVYCYIAIAEIQQKFPLYQHLITYALVTAVLLLVGLIGNTLAFIVVRQDKMTAVTFLIRLILLNDTLLLISAVFHFIPVYQIFTPNAVAQFFKLAYYGGHPWNGIPTRLCYDFTLIFILIMSAERFVAVYFPLKAHEICTVRNTALVVFVMILPPTITRVMHCFSGTESVMYLCDCCLGYPNPVGINAHKPLVFTGFLYYFAQTVRYITQFFVDIIPYMGVLVFNILIMVRIRSASQLRQKMQSEHKDNDALRLVLGISVMFFLLVGPRYGFTVATMLKLYGSTDETAKLMNHVTNTLVFGNSAFNFFLYCLASTKFRRRLKAMFTSKIGAASASSNTQISAVSSTKERN